MNPSPGTSQPSKDTPVETPTAAPGEASVWFKTAGIFAVVLSILVFLYFLAFHLGAAVLSFQKYGSFLWAILDFFFPYFYYPYYAFVVSKEPAPVPESTGMMGGLRRIFRKRTKGFRRL